jgi:Uma2 family endonuclease
MIYPKERSVIVYLPDQLPVVYDLSIMALPMPSFAAGYRLTVSELFGWLME